MGEFIQSLFSNICLQMIKLFLFSSIKCLPDTLVTFYTTDKEEKMFAFIIMQMNIYKICILYAKVLNYNKIFDFSPFYVKLLFRKSIHIFCFISDEEYLFCKYFRNRRKFTVLFSIILA